MTKLEEFFKKYNKGNTKLSLKAISFLMQRYNNFERELKIIHIAGTNGKGSCVEMINQILIYQGYKTGKFISPHLIRYNERICINNVEISDSEFENLIKEVQPTIDEYNLQNEEKVTFFELITFIALLYFYKNKVDFVVIETGLGGKFDATNVITKPLVSIITSIGYDHQHILGNNLEEIAYQKAGIIKEKSKTVFFKQEEEVNNVFINTCKDKNNELRLISKEQIKNYRFDAKYQYFDYKNHKNIAVILKGIKQINNAVVCIECMDILNEYGYQISQEAINQGLKEVVHKARMEVLSESPLIIFDGAHNEPAINNFKSSIKMYYENVDKIYIVSILKRKDYMKMLQILMQNENATIILTSGNDENRYTSKDELFDIAIGLKNNDNQQIYKMELEDAMKYIKENGKNRVSFFIGSFYTYGTVLELLKSTDILHRKID